MGSASDYQHNGSPHPFCEPYCPSPTTSSGSDSSDDSVTSAESVASSQTSLSSQDQWPASQEPYKPSCLPRLQTALHQLCNPRRTSRDGQPPALVRQTERKGQFVYHLVDSATYLVETIWPTSAPVHGCQQGMLPLRTFIEETLRRSKTSFSTLQVALYYIILLKQFVPAYDFTSEQPRDCCMTRALQCGRRMFLAALILGSKYLQDRNYSARAWSKISGLKVNEINLNERALLAAVNWKLHIPEPTFNCWQDILVKYSNPSMAVEWRHAILHITPQYVANYRQSTPILAPTHMAIRSPAISIWSPAVVPSTSTSPSTWPRPMQPPNVPRAFKLTTPSPLSSFCPTPAVSLAGDMLRCTSQPRAMGSAMCIAKTAATMRCMDMAPAECDRYSRRSSLASNVSRTGSQDSISPSVASSPGSMVSDDSSRASSISSFSSQSTSPVRNHLPRLATRNATKSGDCSAAVAAVPAFLDDCVTVIDSEPLTATQFTSSPDVIVIEDESTPTQRCLESMRESRKRPPSVDLSVESPMQAQVRNLLRQNLAVPSAEKMVKYGNMGHAGSRQKRHRPYGFVAAVDCPTRSHPDKYRWNLVS